MPLSFDPAETGSLQTAPAQAQQQQQAVQGETLRRQVETLGAAGRHLGAAGRTARRAGDALGPGLQDARRDVARALKVIRHADRERGAERDFGPSRSSR